MKSLLLAALAVGLTATPVQAGPEPVRIIAIEDAPRVTVSYADLDLWSQAGQDRLDARIRYAAKRVCGDFREDRLEFVANRLTCRQQAIDDAAVQVARIAQATRKGEQLAGYFVIRRSAR
jgi:UrcA family protein